MPTQITQFNPTTGVITGGYTTPYTISFPIRDRAARNGLYLFTNEEDSHFIYTAPPWHTGASAPYALYQYVNFSDGTSLSLDDIGFPFSGNMTPPTRTPFIRLQNYSSVTAWNGLFATDAGGNFYLPAPANHLQVVHPDGSSSSFAWTQHGTLLQILCSASGHLYTLERIVQGGGASITFKDAIYKYTTSGHSVGLWYNQTNYLPQPAVSNIPIQPSVLFDVSSNGNVFGIDASAMTVFGYAGSPYAALFTTPLPGDAPPPCAVCVCEASGCLAVLCCAPATAVSVNASGNDNATPVWDVLPPSSVCRLYLYQLSSGAPILPSWGTTLPFALNACPEYNGLLFDGVANLLFVDKFNGCAAAGNESLACCLDPYGILHVVYVIDGNVSYTHASPSGGPMCAPLTLGAGRAPAIVYTGHRLRAVYLDSTGNYVVQYSDDRGASWSIS